MGDKCILTCGHCAGIWRIDRFGPLIIWLTPVDDEAKMLANLARDGRVGVTTKDIRPLPEQGDTLL